MPSYCFITLLEIRGKIVFQTKHKSDFNKLKSQYYHSYKFDKRKVDL